MFDQFNCLKQHLCRACRLKFSGTSGQKLRYHKAALMIERGSNRFQRSTGIGIRRAFKFQQRGGGRAQRTSDFGQQPRDLFRPLAARYIGRPQAQRKIEKNLPKPEDLIGAVNLDG
jgi:hypothetical protein